MRVRTQEERERLFKRVNRWNKLSYAEQQRRMRVWRHNSFLGHVAMARENMRGIQKSDTTTMPARETAKRIEELLSLLDQQLREERFDG